MPDIGQIGPCSPLLIVADLAATVGHYTGKLGFELRYQAPDDAPFFAIVGRGTAQIMLKQVDENTPPLPNNQRHEWAPWDVFVYVSDPDALAEDFAGRNAALNTPLRDTEDGLRGFEVADPNGYICFFGRPV